MFIDEIQAAFGAQTTENIKRRSKCNTTNVTTSYSSPSRTHSSAHDARLVAHFLYLLDTAHDDEKHTILFVGATNVVDMLDPLLLRAGRLDTVIEIPLPDADARRQLMHNVIYGDWST
uniref:Cell division cycle protein 48 n=1 Tax=Lygus hesperus TaxID=30085 RepID=A0A0A9VUW8_LYGHE